MQIRKTTLATDRKLDDECRKEVLRMLQMKTSKNLIQRHLRLQAGKVVTLKDLHNLARTLGTVTSNTEVIIQESENPPVSEPAASLSPHHKMSLAQPSSDYCSSSPLLQEPFIPHVPQQPLLTSDEETALVSIISSSSQTLLPSQMIKNKRPIAKETTMVRFPIKCKIKKIITPTVPLPFVHKSSVKKEVLILSWILSNPCIVWTGKVKGHSQRCLLPSSQTLGF